QPGDSRGKIFPAPASKARRLAVFWRLDHRRRPAYIATCIAGRDFWLEGRRAAQSANRKFGLRIPSTGLAHRLSALGLANFRRGDGGARRAASAVESGIAR